MYSVGEEFEYLIDDDMEYLTCLANITVGHKEYLICENETGIKRIFYYDSNEENIELVEDDEDEILEVWEEEYYGTDKDYMYWNEDFGEYDKVSKEDELIEDNDEIEDDDIDNFTNIGLHDDEELDDFLDSLFDEDEI